MNYFLPFIFVKWTRAFFFFLLSNYGSLDPEYLWKAHSLEAWSPGCYYWDLGYAVPLHGIGGLGSFLSLFLSSHHELNIVVAPHVPLHCILPFHCSKATEPSNHASKQTFLPLNSFWVLIRITETWITQQLLLPIQLTSYFITGATKCADNIHPQIQGVALEDIIAHKSLASLCNLW